MGIKAEDILINSNGSIYHLNLLPCDIANKIILVGDPSRVKLVSSFFDKIIVKKHNREFITHTGTYKDQLVTVLSTGIGTDNIDIVLNELDALANINLATKKVNPNLKKLSIIRIGTSGTIQPHINVNSIICSKIALGFDGLLNFYKERNTICLKSIENKFIKQINWNKLLAKPYFVEADQDLYNLFKNYTSGITISAPGFYAPQGREIRLKPLDIDLNTRLSSFKYKSFSILNYEMECSAIYGLSKLLGHKAITVCLVIANRFTGKYNSNYKKNMGELIKHTLDKITLNYD